MPTADMRLAWRDAAFAAANHGFKNRHLTKQPVSRGRSDMAADAAVRVVLEHLIEEASLWTNTDDGLWYERFRTLLDSALADDDC